MKQWQEGDEIAVDGETWRVKEVEVQWEWGEAIIRIEKADEA